MVARLYGLIALLYGLSLLALSVMTWLFPYDLVVPTFVVAALIFAPFVYVFTKFGLNSDEGEEPTPETRARLSELASACYWWPGIFYGCVGIVLLSWFVPLLGYPIAHPFYAFSGAISCVTGLWFLLVHSTAQRLFADRKDDQPVGRE